jgi:hypothetical protein
MLSEVPTIFVACFIDFIELFGALLSYNKKGGAEVGVIHARASRIHGEAQRGGG